MDRAAPSAIRLPPVARLAWFFACVALAVLTVFPAPAAAGALPPPPLRLAAVWGRPGWPVAPAAAVVPPPGRWGRDWAAAGPLALPAPPRSPHGRA